MRIFMIFTAIVTTVGMITFGIYLIATKKYIYLGGHVASEKEAFYIGVCNLLFGLAFIFFFVKGWVKKKIAKNQKQKLLDEE